MAGISPLDLRQILTATGYANTTTLGYLTYRTIITEYAQQSYNTAPWVIYVVPFSQRVYQVECYIRNPMNGIWREYSATEFADTQIDAILNEVNRLRELMY